MSDPVVTVRKCLPGAGGHGTSRTECRDNRRADGTDGRVTVQLTPGKEGTSVGDVEFSLTKVGEIQDDTYVLLPAYESTKIDLNTLATAEQLEQAAKTLAETVKPEPGKQTDGTGQVVFESQELGVYLLTAKDQPGYDLVSPTILSLPVRAEDGSFVVVKHFCNTYG